jgi:hypothetical protein
LKDETSMLPMPDESAAAAQMDAKDGMKRHRRTIKIGKEGLFKMQFNPIRQVHTKLGRTITSNI